MLKSQENRIKGAPGEAKIGPRGAPQRFRKTGREQKRAIPGKGQATGSKIGAKT